MKTKDISIGMEVFYSDRQDWLSWGGDRARVVGAVLRQSRYDRNPEVVPLGTPGSRIRIEILMFDGTVYTKRDVTAAQLKGPYAEINAQVEEYRARQAEQRRQRERREQDQRKRAERVAEGLSHYLPEGKKAHVETMRSVNTIFLYPEAAEALLEALREMEAELGRRP